MIKKLLIIGFVAVLILSLCGITSAAININLPTDPVTLRVTPGTNSYFNSRLKKVPSGFDVTNGTYAGWCAHKINNINYNKDYDNTTLYSSYTEPLPSHLDHENWSRVNYIINHKIPGVAWKQVQNAIWYVLDFTPDPDLNSDGEEMIQNAILYGGNYTTTYFNITAIIADAGKKVQRHFIEKRFIDPKVTNLVVLDVHNGNLSLSWDASATNGYLSHYEIFRDDALINTTSSTCFLDTGLQIGQLYTYKVRAVDVDLNKGLFSDPASNISTDTKPPSKVKNLKVEDAHNGNLSLSWSEATDNSGFIHHYEIFRDNKSIANISSLSYLDSGLLLNVLYTYKVRAWDATGNFGLFSDPDSNMSTYLDDVDPDKVGNLTVKDVHNGNLSLSWSAAYDNVGVHHYEIFRDNKSIANTSSLDYLDQNLVIGQLYTYKVRAWDATGNFGPYSNEVSNISTDTKPPSKVKNLQVFDAFNGNLSLSWSAAYDNSGFIHHYEIFRDNKSIDNTTSLNYLDKNLTNGVLYKYNVRAIDAAGNIGDLSNDSYGSPSENDDKPPSKVDNLTVTDAFNGKLQLKWSDAYDNSGFIDHYEIFRDNKSIANTSSLDYLDQNLVNGQKYTYKVRAWDASGNSGPFSDPASGIPTKKSKPKPPSPPNPPSDPKVTGTSSSKNEPPVADASAGEPYMGFINETITFNGSRSYDPDQYIESYKWDFGDETTAEGEIVTHKFTKVGSYDVILTVYDPRGSFDKYYSNVSIFEPNSPPTEPNVTGPTEGFIDINYAFAFYSKDGNSDDIKYVIEWGDDSFSESGFMPSGDLFTSSHKWIQPGNYKIKVTATDGEDNTTKELTITIHDVEIPEENNFILIILALLALMFLLLFILLAKRDKDDEEEQ